MRGGDMRRGNMRREACTLHSIIHNTEYSVSVPWSSISALMRAASCTSETSWTFGAVKPERYMRKASGRHQGLVIKRCMASLRARRLVSANFFSGDCLLT